MASSDELAINRIDPAAAERLVAPVIPNFFLVGAPKCGTTAMYEYLKGHPNIGFSSVKEPFFFDVDSTRPLKMGLKTYLSLFSKVDGTLHQAVGEATASYLFSKVAISEILKFNPNSRFIVMLRNPVEMVQAWHSDMFFKAIENVAEFETAWRLEGERRKGNALPFSCWEPANLFYSEWGKLGDQVERLYSVAARDRVKVIVFDDFIHDPKRAYEDVLTFLGVKPDGRTDFPIVNVNRSLRSAWVQRNLARLVNCYHRIWTASGLEYKPELGLHAKLLRLNSKPTPRKPISPAFKAELRDFYREDVQKLSRLVGRDFSCWVSESRCPEGLDSSGDP